MRILIYAIFTNEYNMLIPHWFEHVVKKFYPKNATALILTDNPDGIEERNVIVRKISSRPFRNQELWMKNERHMEVLEEFKDDYDYFVSIQGNCFLKNVLDETNFPLDPTKLTVFEHTCSGLFDVMSKECCRVGSCGYRPMSSYEGKCCHGGMTMGGFEVMYQMNKDCHEMYLKDKEKGKLHKVPFHDESYINSWRVDNKEKIIMLPRVNSGTLETFYQRDYPFFLVDKPDLGINKAYSVVPKFVPNTRLGNWLFLVAACYAHCLKNGYCMKVPNNYPLLNRILGDRFGCPTEMETVGAKTFTETTYHYSPIPTDARGFISGFFQSSKYFSEYKKEIRELFSVLRSEERYEGAAGIHIRMGDYLKLSARYKSPTKTFLEKAISKLSPNINRLIVFSDEPKKAMELVMSCKSASKYRIINGSAEGDEISDMVAMNACDEFIMSCSSFSWWVAYLGDFKKVIVDKKWYNDNGLNEKDIYEKEWFRI